MSYIHKPMTTIQSDNRSCKISQPQSLNNWSNLWVVTFFDNGKRLPLQDAANTEAEAIAIADKFVS